MAGRETDRGLVRGDVVHPQRLRVVDQVPEDAPAAGEVDPGKSGTLVVRQASGDELLQVVTGGCKDTESAVAGVGQIHGGGDDTVQNRGQVEFAADGQHRRQQPLQPALRSGQSAQLLDDAFQLVVHLEPELRQVSLIW